MERLEEGMLLPQLLWDLQERRCVVGRLGLSFCHMVSLALGFIYVESRLRP